MNIKKTILYILIILLLISLFYFICSKRPVNDDDSFSIYNSETGKIGYMKDVIPEIVEDNSPFPESGAEYKKSNIKKGRTYSARGSNTLSKNKPGIPPLHKDDKEDIDAADKGSEVSSKAVVPSKDTKISVDKSTEKGKADTTKNLQSENIEDIKVAGKSDKSKDIKGIASKPDEKTVIAMEAVPDKASTRENISHDSNAEKLNDKGEVQEDSAKVSVKEITPLQGDKDSIDDAAEISKLEDKKITDNIDKKYNRLDSVGLYSGRVLTGTVTERGDVYTIITTEGKEKILKKDIQGNEIIK